MRRLALACLLTGWVFTFGCFNSRFFYPTDVDYGTPARYGLDYEDVSFQSSDQTELHGWFIPAVGRSEGTVIFFYGDFANRTYNLKHVYWLARMGFNLFTFDYRGYGDSGGVPDRTGIYLDSVAAIRYVLSRPECEHGNLFVYGQSLGGVFAIAAVAKNQFPSICAVVVEGTFTSFRAEACYMMKHVSQEAIGRAPCITWSIPPVAYLGVGDALSPIDLVDQISPIPLLLIHCRGDTAVPYAQAEQLFNRAKAPKMLWQVDGCEHVRLFIDWDSSPKYRRKLAAFFKAHQCDRP